MAARISNAAAIAAANALTALLAAGGTLELRTGSAPTNVEDPPTGTLLATLTLAVPAFGAAADINPGARATANAITGDVSADTSGLAGWFRAYTTGAVGVIQGTVGGSFQATTGDLQLANAQLVVGQDVEIVYWTINLPEG